MTVKEQLHQIVDALDDERAEAALVVLVKMLNEPVGAGDPRRVSGARDIATPEELRAVARSTSADDPLWEIVGMIKDGPSDLAENHDKYLADAYADLHEE
ncbi:MAG: hypothetical protein ACRDJW_05285 [Thermomicrobiales bacterium]